jgi:hypothetical protein
MGAHFYCITIDSANYLPLFTLNGLARSDCFAHALSVKRGRGGWVVGRASSQILGTSFTKSADNSGPIIIEWALVAPWIFAGFSL